MFRLLLLLPLALSLIAQDRPRINSFDASMRCFPKPGSPDCDAPDDQITVLTPRPKALAVSVYRLAHKVPSKARKAWNRAAHAAEKGRVLETVELLDEALTHDGDFADALHMRGLFAYQSKDFRRAAALLDRAATLDDANAAFLADAALAELTIRNPVGAERYARASLRLNPEQPRALLVLNHLKP